MQLTTKIDKVKNEDKRKECIYVCIYIYSKIYLYIIFPHPICIHINTYICICIYIGWGKARIGHKELF